MPLEVNTTCVSTFEGSGHGGRVIHPESGQAEIPRIVPLLKSLPAAGHDLGAQKCGGGRAAACIDDEFKGTVARQSSHIKKGPRTHAGEKFGGAAVPVFTAACH